MMTRKLITYISAFLLTVAICATVAAQGRATLRGSVNDEVGAVIVGATVTLTDASGGAPKTAQSGADGGYVFNGLTPGKYMIHAEAAGFSASEPVEVEVTTARRDPLMLTLKVAEIESEVSVAADTPINTDAASNANQQVISGKDLEALPDDPDELAAALQALAGPSIGPGGGQIFIDGFSGANMPPKESIREIRINQNPFAAENDQPSGRIDILTRPGTDKFRGGAYFNFTDESLNSRNPFAVSSNKRAPFQLRHFGGNVSGPLIANKMSFFFDINRDETDDNELVRATILDENFNITQFGIGFLTPRKRTGVGTRIEYAINSRNTLIGRYNYNRNETENNGVGNFSLPERAYDFVSTNQNVQLTETAVINATTINETRFQFSKNRNESLGNNTIPTLNVSGAFSGCTGNQIGCSQVGHATTERTGWELNNFTQMQMGMHTIKFGGRVRNNRIEEISPNNFGGAWSFNGGAGPQLDAANNPIGPNVVLSSIERYRRTVAIASQGALTAQQQAFCGPGASFTQCIRTLGGGASQFSINTGNPEASVSQTDLGVYAQDDWRIRPNFTLSYGLRYEYQTNADSRFNFAPRLGFAWSPGGGAQATRPPKMVIRGGIGVFYNRFSEGQTLQANRFNGLNQLQFAVPETIIRENGVQRPPTAAEQAATANFALLNIFPVVPNNALLALIPPTQQTVYRVDSNLQAPNLYLMGLQVERQLPKNITMFVGAYTMRMTHGIRLRDINAPLPPTFTTRPIAGAGDIYQYESSGNFRMSQMFVGFNSRLNPRLSLSGNYSLAKASGDFDGFGGSGLPMNSYDLSIENGRTSGDVRHRFTIFGTITSPWWGLTFNPFVIANTGPPFNITTGQDLNLDRAYNERPTFAQLNAFCTNPNNTSRCSTFDFSSTSNEFIPRNYGQSPGSLSVNLRVGKTFTFGGESAPRASAGGGGGGQRGGGGRGAAPSVPGAGGQRGPGGPPGGGMMMGGPGGGGAGRYSLNVSINVQNLFNKVNLGRPEGNLTSTNFGQSLGLAGSFGGFGGGGGGSTGAGNRRVFLNLRFNF